MRQGGELFIRVDRFRIAIREKGRVVSSANVYTVLPERTSSPGSLLEGFVNNLATGLTNIGFYYFRDKLLRVNTVHAARPHVCF